MNSANELYSGILFCVAVWLAGMALVNFVFALGVLREAKNYRLIHGDTLYMSPEFWCLATLLGSVFAGTAYWLIHRSQLNKPDQQTEVSPIE